MPPITTGNCASSVAQKLIWRQRRVGDAEVHHPGSDFREPATRPDRLVFDVNATGPLVTTVSHTDLLHRRH